MNHLEQQPWWNDKDKAGGLAATIVLIGLAFFVAAFLISMGVLLVTWAF